MGQSRREFRTEAYVALAYFRGGSRVDAVAREPRRRGGLRRGDAPSGTIRPDGCVLSPPCPAWCAFVQRKTSVDARFSPVRRSACRLLPRARRRPEAAAWTAPAAPAFTFTQVGGPKNGPSALPHTSRD
ncbi:hypothetical protein PVAP13_1KG508526 [Panicum virgatum]|uniref:Uncharacterized protein n=1 Tax=Panicum virgatum TaxID=38727 RepID=A0A8T0Y278_PANVG|nr:hypothetical protein PVAP13_1KG508526 [Panicum virgatum]